MLMTTQPISLSPRQCQNGNWTGKQCVCEQGFTGLDCESLLISFPIEIPGVISGNVTTVVKVTYRNFTEDLKNHSSEAYKNFTRQFTEQMNKIYSDISEYKGVAINRLLSGSIVVENTVLLEASYTPDYRTQFARLREEVRARLMNETSVVHNNTDKCQVAMLCYNETDTTVNAVQLDFDPQEQCIQKAAKDFARFFYVDELDGRLACVTPCTERTKSQLRCHPGQCQLLRSGPRCLCPNTDTHWYWGDTCEHKTSKALVYGIVGTVAVVLLVLVVVLALFLGRSRRKLHREKYDVSPVWQRERLPSSFENTGVWEGNNLKEDRFGLETGYSHFRPSLENVDPRRELHIQRPRVVKSSP
ncbi:mucin-12-like [Perognathus longimembris pacificus]|uniref:mucin-12-like n=1 Tax=Perognathus longimembris pacificus TaxID=214514 RepID=UPI002019C6B0|nr:mucin-12-like [Perognathus longimembris pacificus]